MPKSSPFSRTCIQHPFWKNKLFAENRACWAVWLPERSPLYLSVGRLSGYCRPLQAADAIRVVVSVVGAGAGAKNIFNCIIANIWATEM